METIEYAIHLFTAGEVSIGRAAHIADMCREDFMRLLGERQIPIINHDPIILQEELIRLRRDS